MNEIKFISDQDLLIPRLLGTIARESEHEANAYVFLTGPASGGGLGLAGKSGSVCDSDRGERISISQYKGGEWKGPDSYTAEVRNHTTFENIISFIRANINYHGLPHDVSSRRVDSL